MMGVDGRATLGGIFSLLGVVLIPELGAPSIAVSLCLSLPRLQSTRHRLGLQWLGRPGAAIDTAAEGENWYRPGQCEMRS